VAVGENFQLRGGAQRAGCAICRPSATRHGAAGARCCPCLWDWRRSGVQAGRRIRRALAAGQKSAKSHPLAGAPLRFSGPVVRGRGWGGAGCHPQPPGGRSQILCLAEGSTPPGRAWLPPAACRTWMAAVENLGRQPNRWTRCLLRPWRCTLLDRELDLEARDLVRWSSGPAWPQPAFRQSSRSSVPRSVADGPASRQLLRLFFLGKKKKARGPGG